MHPSFWKDIWRKGRIGFHQKEINEQLCRFFPTLGLSQGSQVFVPLCGKSHDMLWLRERGHRVLGVELSRIAVRDFFMESELEPEVTTEPGFERWGADGIELLCGDFFNLTPEHLAEVAGFYDRAALVALPPDMRPVYADHLAAILPSEVTGLLLGAEYDENEMDGPPFSVREKEIRALFEKAFEIELAVRDDILEVTRFRERLTTLFETVFILHRPISGKRRETTL